MLRYFKKIRDEPTSNKSSPPPPPPPPPPAPLDADSNEYPSDPGLRKHILEYNVNEREIVRCFYLQKEYSIAKDAAFCLYYYLFKADHGGQSGGDSFVTEGFKNWRKKDNFNEHVGNQSNIHNRFLVDYNEDINSVTLDNAPSNLKLTSPDIQKDIIISIAYLTTNSIFGDLDDELFTILVDEARDISIKEQMAVALRFVDERGNIVERFLGIVHVSDTTALSLKTAIDSLLCQHGLSISNLRGQGYNRASNMRGEFNGLKSLIMMENPSAYYVHYFAHQLQLTLVAVAENHIRISTFFYMVAQLNNIVGASCKRRDILHEKQFEKVIKGIDNVIDVLLFVEEEGKDHKQRVQANNLLELIEKYEFIFQMHLMKNILGVTNDLLQALQRKDQDIVNAMILVRSSKHQLQTMRDDGWDLLLNEVSLFFVKYKELNSRFNELALLLPVATAIVERVFSAMKIIKTLLRNLLRDDMFAKSVIGAKKLITYALNGQIAFKTIY
ncbi:uncharacterized protein LOC122002524 [Zingiber officinale]|uniref:uncharacterized protein LOC122002524 n=1 Tax=Zingiber officinale TaxID=94328 RepID=UPI001C4D32BE|nr:uncharacterized protein LOC122002524 [Zingiber officinale]